MNRDKREQGLFTRNFSLLLLGQISSLMGNYSLRFALSMFVLEKTGSASVFSQLLAAAMVPTILLSPFGGILADRADRVKTMVALDALSATAVLLAGLALSVANPIAVAGVLLVVLSVLGAFESPTVQACVPQMLPQGMLVKGNAAVGQIQALSALVTPFLGSILYTAFGIRAVLGGTVACFAVTALLECWIRLERTQVPPAGGAGQGVAAVVREDFAQSARFLHREQPCVLKLLLLAALMSMFVVGTVVVGFPYLVRTVLGLSAEHYGVAESAMGMAAVLGSLAVGVLARRGKRRLGALVAAVGMFLLGAGLAFVLPMPVIGRYLLLMLCFCGCQFGASAFSIYAVSMIQERTPEHITGKVMSYVYTISMCAQPLGQLLYGRLFDLFSHRAYGVLLPSGVVVCLIALGAWGFLENLDRGRSLKEAGGKPQ